jgi:hypothetical protein
MPRLAMPKRGTERATSVTAGGPELRGWRAQFELGGRNFCFPVKSAGGRSAWQACVRMAPSSGRRAARARAARIASLSPQYHANLCACRHVRACFFARCTREAQYVHTIAFICAYELSAVLLLRPAPCMSGANPLGRPFVMNARQARLQARVPQARLPHPRATQPDPALAPTHRHRPRARSEALRDRALAARCRWMGPTARPVCAGVGR